MPFNPVDIIIAKRESATVAAPDIQTLIDAYTAGDVPDYQVSAFLMAAFLNGLNAEETTALTHSMLHSGMVLDLSDIPGTKVDKHSTGGVGDKISLILAPLVAACGVPVPMISGRGLGHSGGTLDKLESIPGFRTDLDIPTYRKQLEDLGLVMIGQTAEIAPADRKLYALRDVTGTVECIPFIASSIMSKKLAEGIDALVLDVKCGKGAFMKTEETADALARTLIRIGTSFNKEVVAWMTAMDQPLGKAIGNWVEVEESIRCLRGEPVDDVMEVTYALCSEMLVLGKVADTTDQARDLLREAIDSGRALDMLARLVEQQGGDPNVITNPESRPGPAHKLELIANDDEEGYVATIDALALGKASVMLGAGRLIKEASVDPTAGIVLDKKEGDPIQKGDRIATLMTSQAVDLEALSQRVRDAYTYTDSPPTTRPLLMKRYASR